MKKYFIFLSFILVTGLCTQSCQQQDSFAFSNENASPQKVVRTNSTSSLEQLQSDLVDLDLSFNLESVVAVQHEDWEFTELGPDWNIVVADAAGAYYGGKIGAAIGGPWGAAIGGIIVGGAASYVEYKKEEEMAENDDESNGDGLQIAIDANNPFIYYPTDNRFGYVGTPAIGSEIGELHNQVVSDVLLTNSSSPTTLSDCLNYLCTTEFASLDTRYNQQQIELAKYYLIDNENELVQLVDSDPKLSLSNEDSFEMDIIKRYAYVISQSSMLLDRFRYTREFMAVVDNAFQNSLISEESALIINGTISTMYCSKIAWNYIQPDPMWANMFIIYTEQAWYITDSHDYIFAMLHSNPNIRFIGYPYIENSSLKRIYIHGNSPYNQFLGNSYLFMCQPQDYALFTNTTDCVYITCNVNCNSIPIANYPIYPAIAHDNYMYIDLEIQ